MYKFYIFMFVVFYFPFGMIFENNQKEAEDLNITEFVSNYGYPIETHEVETEDGYILTLFRISHSQNELQYNSNEYPVLVNHALAVSSEIYVLLGPKKSLAFVLADNGYDVWLMNARGAWHSRRHKKLKPNEKQFWKFSWHEIGIYDIPAVINYVLKTTSKIYLHYVGHSQGTTSFFVMGSERPEFLSKIKVMIALAPGARYKYMKNVMLKMISPHYKLLEALSDYLELFEIPPPFFSGKTIRKLLNIMCLKSDRLNIICKFIAEVSSPMIDLLDLPHIISGVPSTFSVKQPLHYAQLIASGNFQQYDLGLKKNLKRYGTEVPPLYNLKNVSCPVALFWGPSDEFVAEEDLQFLRGELPNIVEDFRIPMDSFTHIDFVLGHNLSELLYYRILEVMEKYK